MIRRNLLVLCLLVVAGQALGQGVALPVPQRVELDNGIVLLVQEKNDVPLIGLQAMIRSGATTDPAGKAGLASLVAGLLERGAGDRNARAFAEAVDSAGGYLSASADLEAITIAADFMARDADLMVELVADMLRSPRFDGAEVRKLRDRRINLLKAAKDNDPRRLTPLYGNAFLFGEHPYGAPVDGDEQSLASIGRDDVRAYYNEYFGANRVVIAVVGDFDATTMIRQLSVAFADWRPADGVLPEVQPATSQSGRRVLLVDKPGATQTYFWIGNVGVTRDYAQRAELDVANTLFGGRFTSLLIDELRTKAGLTYGASSTLLRPSTPGSVAIVSYTKTEATAQAIDLALSLLGRLHENGFDPELVQSGKNYILGLFPPKFETAAQLAAQFATLETYGLDASYINAYGPAVANATDEAVRAVISSVYPTQENLVFAIIGDAQAIRETVSRYGPITEMALTDPRFAAPPQ